MHILTSHFRIGIQFESLSSGQTKEGSQMRCSIYTSRISDKEAYEASGYVWDPSNLTVEIRCGDQMLLGTESLKNCSVPSSLHELAKS